MLTFLLKVVAFLPLKSIFLPELCISTSPALSRAYLLLPISMKLSSISRRVGSFGIHLLSSFFPIKVMSLNELSTPSSPLLPKCFSLYISMCFLSLQVDDSGLVLTKDYDDFLGLNPMDKYYPL